MTTTLIGRLAKLDSEIAEHTAAITKLKAKRVGIAEQALDYMSRHGIMRQAVNGRTVYVAHEVWAGKLSEEDGGLTMPSFVACVQEHGMPELATYSPQRLTAWARELREERETELQQEGKTTEEIMELLKDSKSFMPLWLAPHVKVSEVDKIKSRKS